MPASTTTGIQVTKKKNSRLAILRLVITQANELLPNSGTLGVFFSQSNDWLVIFGARKFENSELTVLAIFLKAELLLILGFLPVGCEI